MLQRLLNQTAAPSLESVAGFHAARHRVLADNVANISTPGYRTKDLDEGAFRERLRRRIETGQGTADVGRDALVFHDGNDRDVEQLVSDQATNALRHNMAVELLRKQYALLTVALSERAG